MKQIFVSYVGRKGGQPAQGWAVYDCGPIDSPSAVTDLVVRIEDDRHYDPGTLVLINFRRLEDGPSDTNGVRTPE